MREADATPSLSAPATSQSLSADAAAPFGFAKPGPIGGVVFPPSSNQDQEREENRVPLVAVDGWLDGAPAWLMSAVLHLLILVLCALLAFSTGEESRLTLSAIFADDLGDQLIEESFDLSAALELEVEEQSLTPDMLPPVPDPLATPELAEITPDGPSFASNALSPTLGAALSGRTPGMRQALLKAYGGTEETEAAVMEGLKWLARQQQKDGGWRLDGPYPDGARRRNREAATAMALLAFQGAGRLPGDKKDPYSRVVERGWRWLLPRQDTETGSFFTSGARNHRFYTHAQCTIALCELLGMTQDDAYRQPAQLAVDYLIQTQAESGGWKYEPGENSDLSVTGWVLMALKSARMAGLEVPSDVFLRVEEFLDKVARVKGSRYVYEEPIVYNPEQIPAMTAEGLLCRQYLGWPRDHIRLRQGVDHLLENLPEWRTARRDVYYWYYATQVCHHMGGATWDDWNRKMREMLPAHQELRGRGVRGSWDPEGDRWGDYGGRLYQTCMSLYILEVYYRHLPIYQQGAVNEAR